jgi:hypothetical protein
MSASASGGGTGVGIVFLLGIFIAVLSSLVTGG